VHVAAPVGGGRRLCCGRTFLAAGLVDEARREAARLLDVLRPFAEAGTPIVGLEPSCLLALRDEIPALIGRDETSAVAGNALLFEEYLVREADAGRLDLPLKPVAGEALVHGHCHQKSFDAFAPVIRALKLVPDLAVTAIESSCCGMAGAFGYGADTFETSMAMGELSLLPAVRAAAEGAIIVADGTSCRQQIADGAGREASHAAVVLAAALAGE
jgi:Fe-S oxidoreductase